MLELCIEDVIMRRFVTVAAIVPSRSRFFASLHFLPLTTKICLLISSPICWGKWKPCHRSNLLTHNNNNNNLKKKYWKKKKREIMLKQKRLNVELCSLSCCFFFYSVYLFFYILFSSLTARKRNIFRGKKTWTNSEEDKQNTHTHTHTHTQTHTHSHTDTDTHPEIL